MVLFNKLHITIVSTSLIPERSSLSTKDPTSVIEITSSILSIALNSAAVSLLLNRFVS